MAYTNFCCRSGGSNLNAGTRTGDTTEPSTSAFKTYTGGTWVQATRTFTPAGGANPTTDGLAVGDFVSVYPDATTTAVYIARISTVGSTTFVTDATAFSGTAPADGVVNTSAKIGGAWLGPNGASGFPIGTITNVLQNATGNQVRINLKNDQTYSISTGLSTSQNRLTIQGYTSAYGDLGRATIDGSTNTIVLLTLSGASIGADLILQNNGASGTNAGFVLSGGFSRAVRCVVNTVRGDGFSITGSSGVELEECEAYACNGANTASSGGFVASSGPVLRRCISHDNTGNANNGLVATGSAVVTVDRCIFDTNGNAGTLVTNSFLSITRSDYYSNGTSGILGSGASPQVTVESSNFVANGGYGISDGGSATRLWHIRNCGFGSGTAANSSGTITGTSTQEFGSVVYASNLTPWVDPANGDFRINLAAAKGTGRGTFTETATSFAGTIGYPDIGAAQHLETASGAAFTWVG